MGNISTNGTISATGIFPYSTGSTYIGGIKQTSRGIVFPQIPTKNAYWPLINFRTAYEKYVSIGLLNNEINLLVANSDRTENGCDYSFVLDLDNGKIATNLLFNGTSKYATYAYADANSGFDIFLAGYIADGTDLNDTTLRAGNYRLENSVVNGWTSHNYGQLLVLRGQPWSDTHVQIGFPYNSSDMYFRCTSTAAGWTSKPWQKVQKWGDTLNTTNYGTSNPSGAPYTGSLYFKII